jgi:threonine 3-dehydrogenase
MKGIVKTSAAPGAVLKDVPIPEVGERDLLVRIKAAAICGTDLHIMHWTPWAQERIHPPMVFGHEFAGEVVSTGAGVRRFKAGDRVAGETHIPCGSCRQCLTGNQHICESMKIIGVHVPGAFAEYIAIPEACAWPLSEGLTYEQGAFLEPMGVAMHGVEAAGNLGGKDVLLLGCGPIGVMAAAIARSRGANQVICTDVAPAKLELARKMGATLALDAQGPAVRQVMEATNGEGAGVVIDYSGSGHAIADGLKALKKGGTMVFVGLPSGPVSLDLSDGVIYKEAKLFGVTGRTMYGTWFECEKALRSGKIDLAPVVGGTYALGDFEEAFAALGRQAPGKMLLIP